jgi:hypothetical protein
MKHTWHQVIVSYDGDEVGQYCMIEQCSQCGALRETKKITFGIITEVFRMSKNGTRSNVEDCK